MRDFRLASLIIAAALAVGCNKDEATTPSAPPAPTSPAAPASPTADMTPPPAATPTAPPTTAPANDAMAAATIKANELLQQGLQYAKETSSTWRRRRSRSWKG